MPQLAVGLPLPVPEGNNFGLVRGFQGTFVAELVVAGPWQRGVPSLRIAGRQKRVGAVGAVEAVEAAGAAGSCTFGLPHRQVAALRSWEGQREEPWLGCRNSEFARGWYSW